MLNADSDDEFMVRFNEARINNTYTPGFFSGNHQNMSWGDSWNQQLKLFQKNTDVGVKTKMTMENDQF